MKTVATLVDVELGEKKAPVREELDPERGARGEDVAGSRAAAEHANLGNGRVYLCKSCEQNIFIKIINKNKFIDLRREGTLSIPHFYIVPARMVGVVLSHLCMETKVYEIERHIFSMKKILNLD